MKTTVNQYYWTQHDDNANPPSFLLTIDSLISQKKIDEQYLKEIYPRLHAWFDWYNKTQIGHLMGTYRWRGRDIDNLELNPDTPTSGQFFFIETNY
jgi:mannosyl-oligosaccharide glucosidase